MLLKLCRFFKRISLVLAAAAIIFGSVFCFAFSSSRSVTAFSASSNEPTVIIDPGHGGEDGGAVSPNGLLESGLNLEIAQRLEAIMMLFDVPAVMTRDSEDIDYPDSAATVHERKAADTRARTEFIGSYENAVLISIHQNKYTGPSPFGAQAFYSPTGGSRELAESIQSGLVSFLDTENYRTATAIPDSIYIMNHVSCPAVLVECGFLSNPGDESKLRTPAYQIKLAAIISASVFSFGGTNES